MSYCLGEHWAGDCCSPGGRCLPEGGFWLRAAPRRNPCPRSWQWWASRTSGPRSRRGSGRRARDARRCTAPRSGTRSCHMGSSAAGPSAEESHRRVHCRRTKWAQSQLVLRKETFSDADRMPPLWDSDVRVSCHVPALPCESPTAQCCTEISMLGLNKPVQTLKAAHAALCAG